MAAGTERGSRGGEEEGGGPAVGPGPLGACNGGIMRRRRRGNKTTRGGHERLGAAAHERVAGEAASGAAAAAAALAGACGGEASGDRSFYGGLARRPLSLLRCATAAQPRSSN